MFTRVITVFSRGLDWPGHALSSGRCLPQTEATVTTQALAPSHPATGAENTLLQLPTSLSGHVQGHTNKEASFPVTRELELSLGPAGEGWAAPRGVLCSCPPPQARARGGGLDARQSRRAGRLLRGRGGGWSALGATRHLHLPRPSSPLPPTVTMRILKSIRSLSCSKRSVLGNEKWSGRKEPRRRRGGCGWALGPSAVGGGGQRERRAAPPFRTTR